MPRKTRRSSPSDAMSLEEQKDRRKRRGRLFRRAALLFLLFTLFELLYQVILFIERSNSMPGDVAFPLYFAAAGILFFVFILLNHGLSREPVTEENISGIYTKDARIRMAEKINRGKKRARVLLYFLLPVVLVLFFDLFDLFFLTPLLSALA